MSEADQADGLRTNAVPESDVPGPGGSDSVLRMHESVMHVMNDPVVLSVDGTAAGPDDDDPDTTAGGRDTVQAMHDIFMREQAEPHDGFEPVPMWVSVVFGGLLMWGGYYIGTNSADFRRDIFDGSEIRFANLKVDPGAIPPDPDPKTVSDLMKIGEQKYRSICIACHKPDGGGDPTQQYPPLVGSEWVAGSEASPARLARILLYGLQQPIAVKGKQFNGQMPAQSGAMKDYEIAAVITYVRNSFGNKADLDDANPAVSTTVVKAARAKAGKREPMTAPELQRLPVTESDLPPVQKK